MPLTGQKIAIIGAGIGGLAAARALRCAGQKVTVLEQAECIREVGAGLQISPNGAAVLRGLGLRPELFGMASDAVRLVDHHGRTALRMDLGGLPDRNGYFFCHRADLIAALAHGARKAGARVRLLQRVEDVVTGEAPEIHIANRARMRPALVVGADGLHSRLRAAILGDSRARFTGQVCWRAVVPAAPDDPKGPMRASTWGRGVTWSAIRCAAERCATSLRSRNAANGPPDSWSHEDNPDNLRRAFAGFCPDVQSLLERVSRVNLWGLHRHEVAPKWYDGRTALLGDAAHPTLPFLAQGANLALEDAWVLSETLAEGLDGAAGPEAAQAAIGPALERYQQARRDRARRAIQTANRNAWKYHLRFPPLRMAAHAALRLGGKVAPGAILHQFDWLYGHDVTGGQRLAADLDCPVSEGDLCP